MTKPSLTLWVDRLKGDRVLAALIGCTTDSLPPLGSYFDFMDRLWTAPATGLYARDRLLPASRNSKKPDKPKEKKQKAQETKPKITEVIGKRLMDGKDIPFNFEERLQRFFYHAAVLPSMECSLILSPAAQMLIRRSIINAPPQNGSITASSMIMACTVCSYTQRSIILS